MIPFCQRVLDRVPGKPSNVSNWHFLAYYSFETNDLLYYFLPIIHLPSCYDVTATWLDYSGAQSFVGPVLSDVKNYGGRGYKDIGRSKGGDSGWSLFISALEVSLIEAALLTVRFDRII
ncbi:hypothetical protein AVEN_115110-1 [Araneus ventricosus]|uniref:Uncharacterized protein n=1 Tax=Araneus ventricosus TaxID=182803 RepID=A0A4Y1ZXG3_ARAVE|nr:hypothetical protein AVEN_115110-1 [Araneus ventricosus]